MPTTSTYRHPLKRQPWFVGHDGVPTTVKMYDDKLTYTFDLTDLLASGETVSSATWTSNGPTLTSASVSSPQHSITVEGSGEADVVVATSASRELNFTYRWQAQDAAPLKDYV